VTIAFVIDTMRGAAQPPGRMVDFAQAHGRLRRLRLVPIFREEI